MSSSRNFYSSSDKNLQTGANTCSEILTAQYAAYAISAADAAAYADSALAFSNAYDIAIAPATRTKITIGNKDVARRKLKADSVNLYKRLSSNPTVTNEQLEALMMAPRPERTPVPPPATAPRVELTSVRGRTINVRLHDDVSPRRGKPSGVSGASVFSHIGPSAPANLSDYKFEGNLSRTSVDIEFDSSVPAGSTVWIVAFWFNNRKESGPASTAASINLAGGNVSMAA